MKHKDDKPADGTTPMSSGTVGAAHDADGTDADKRAIEEGEADFREGRYTIDRPSERRPDGLL